MMGGRIEVESVYGEGSVFTAKMKQGAADAALIDEATARNLKSFSYHLERNKRGKNLVLTQMPYGRVLVVDDVVTNLDVAKGILLPYGLTVDCADGGREAVRLVREGEHRYDLIFMDHMMPEMDGVEAVRVIREIGSEYARNVPIVALTANALTGNDNMFKEHGFQDFLSKPIDIMKMDVVLNTWVKDAKREKERSAADGDPAPPKARPKTPPAGTRGTASLGGARIEGLDMEDGLRRLGGKESVYITILRSFAGSMPAMLERVRTCDADNLPDYTIAVHGIKGGCRNVGAKALGDEAEALEMAAKAGDLDRVNAGTGAFVAGVERLLANIGAALG
jgi:CheY-like chemotaxis protein